MKTGLTERTVKSLQLNAGVLLLNYTKGGEIAANDILGATRGGGSFSAVPTMHQVAVDGAPTYVKGLERCDDWVVTLNTTMVELNEEALSRAFGVGVSKSGTTDKTFTVKNTVASTDYKDLYWVGDLSSGQNIVIKIKNALNTGGLNLTFSDRGEGTYALALIGHYALDDLETAPFDLIYEEEEAE